MEKLLISVAQMPYVFSSNLEAEPLVVQLVKEGEKWRLKLASPVVGLAGGSTSSSRYGDYFRGYVGKGHANYSKGSYLEQQRYASSYYRFDHFEHQSTVNCYFSTMGISALIKDLNLLQLKLQKQPTICGSELGRLVEKQLKKVYWCGFSLGKSCGFKRSQRAAGLMRFGVAESFQHAVEEQSKSMALGTVVKRDYEKFLHNLYEYPPRPYIPHYGPNKVWGVFWACEALGILGVNRSHSYDKKTKEWLQLHYEDYFPAVKFFYPPFYMRSLPAV